MSFELPETPNLTLRREGFVLHLTFNRPKVRNAMSLAMVDEIIAVFDAISETNEIRAVVLRGAGGHFCAGGDIKDMAAARMSQPATPGGPDDPLVVVNRKFGTMMSVIETAPQAVIAVLEGAVMGGGFGLACVADVGLCHAEAKFRLPETSLGIPPAQIAAFIVRRIGLTQGRRFAVTGGRFDGRRALSIGLVHELFEDEQGLDALLAQTLAEIRRCAPGAVAVTKDLMLSSLSENIEVLLDRAARDFAMAIRSGEGQEGTMAFIEKRPAAWAREDA